MRRLTNNRKLLWALMAAWVLGLPVYLKAQSQPALQPDPELSSVTILLKSIEERNAELDQKAEELRTREERLKILERDVQALVEKYTRLRNEVKEKLEARDAEREVQLRRLAKMFEAMPPKKAVAQMENMDEAVVLDLFAQIKEKKAAPILAEMNPRKAAEITEKLAKTPR